MGRKSSGTPVVAEVVAPTAVEVQAASRMSSTDYTPTDAERRLRARFWAEMRHDPLFRPENVTLDGAAAIVKSDALQKSWGKKGFREWFLRKRDVEEKAEFLLDVWTEELGLRLAKMSDKDFIQAGKLLADIVAKQAEAAQQTDPLAGLTPEQLAAKLEPLLLAAKKSD